MQRLVQQSKSTCQLTVHLLYQCTNIAPQTQGCTEAVKADLKLATLKFVSNAPLCQPQDFAPLGNMENLLSRKGIAGALPWGEPWGKGGAHHMGAHSREMPKRIHMVKVRLGIFACCGGRTRFSRRFASPRRPPSRPPQSTRFNANARNTSPTGHILFLHFRCALTLH